MPACGPVLATEGHGYVSSQGSFLSVQGDRHDFWLVGPTPTKDRYSSVQKH